MDDADAADRVRTVVDAIDEAWRAAWWDLLADQLAPGVALAPPGEAPPVVGVEACVDTWRAFAAVAQVARYAAGARSIHVDGDTAVATRPWSMAWARDGRDHAERGRDVLVLVRRDGRWRVTWRTLTSAPTPSGPGPPRRARRPSLAGLSACSFAHARGRPRPAGANVLSA